MAWFIGIDNQILHKTPCFIEIVRLDRNDPNNQPEEVRMRKEPSKQVDDSSLPLSCLSFFHSVCGINTCVSFVSA